MKQHKVKKFKEKMFPPRKGEKIFHSESGKFVGYIYSGKEDKL